MKIMHSSDWHIGRFLNKFNLIDDQAHFLNWLLLVLKSEKIKILIIAGDVYNTASPSASAVSLLDEFFTKVVLELKIKVVLISGNHDSAEKLSFSSKILQSSGLFLAGGLKGVQQIEFDFDDEKIKIFLLPFFNLTAAKRFFNLKQNDNDEKIFQQIFKNVKMSNYGFNLACAHGLFVDYGHSLSYCDSETVVGESELFNLNVFKNFDYVALGHLHKPQLAGKNGFYCGSPIKYSLSEVNDKKRVNVLNLGKNKKIEINSIFVEPLHDLKIVKGSFFDLLKLKTNDYVSIQLTDETFLMNPYSKIQVNCPNILELSYVNVGFKFVKELVKLKKQSPLDLFSVFFKQVVGREMNKIENDIFLKVVKEQNSINEVN